MLQLRKSSERGHAHHGWLKSHHSFSFADYYDPRHMGFRSLRVINEDFIEGHQGFGAHPHRDMEIITYVVKGALEHQDSMGTKAEILPGEVQYMSAGTGVVHSEQNRRDGEVHLFQIWILPSTPGGKPRYGQKSFEKELASGELVQVISPDGRDGSIEIKQDASLYIARPKADKRIDFPLHAGRSVWIQTVRGSLKVNEQNLEAGDAIAAWDEVALQIEALEDSEFLLFDVV